MFHVDIGWATPDICCLYTYIHIYIYNHLSPSASVKFHPNRYGGSLNSSSSLYSSGYAQMERWIEENTIN